MPPTTYLNQNVEAEEAFMSAHRTKRYKPWTPPRPRKLAKLTEKRFKAIEEEWNRWAKMLWKERGVTIVD